MADEIIDSKEPLSTEDILDELNKDDSLDDKDDSKILEEDKEDEEDEEELETEENEDEEKDEDEDEEPELKEEDETDLELAEIPRRSEIKAAYPDFFKKFPAIDHIMQREKQYSQIFHTVGDAKEAAERLTTFKQFEGELFSGDLAGVLKSVKDSDEGSFNKIVDNYFGALFKVDKTAHLNLTNNIFKGVVSHIYNQVKDETDGDTERGQLKLAARLIYKAMYGTNEVKGPDVKESAKPNENSEENKLKTERAKFENERLQTAAQDVIGRAERVITKFVTDQVDPRGDLPDYVKGKIIGDVIKSLDETMRRDVRYRTIIDRLYVESKASNYSDESKKKIVNTILKKAKSILPGAIKAKKAEAMRGLNFRRRESSEEEIPRNRGTREPQDKREKITTNRRDSDRNQMKPGESVKSYLMRD